MTEPGDEGREMGYACPNGHRVHRVRVHTCSQCRAGVVYEPEAHGRELERRILALCTFIHRHHHGGPFQRCAKCAAIMEATE
jgi:hypothetical protein